MANSVKSNQFARQILSSVLCFVKNKGKFKLVVVVVSLLSLSLGKSSWVVDTEQSFYIFIIFSCYKITIL